MKLGARESEKTIQLPEGDWPVSFEAVRLAQHLRFRALSAREKIQAMEDMAELVERFRQQRGADLAAGSRGEKGG